MRSRRLARPTMASLAAHRQSLVVRARMAVSPELADPAYCTAVLCLEANKTEDDLDAELFARATELAIPTLPPSSPALSPAQLPASDAPIDQSLSLLTSSPSTPATTPLTAHPHHLRTASSISHVSMTTDATSLSSLVLPPMLTDAPQLRPPEHHQRPKALSFSLYNKYLARIDSSLSQPKPAAAPSDEPHTTPTPPTDPNPNTASSSDTGLGRPHRRRPSASSLLSRRVGRRDYSRLKDGLKKRIGFGLWTGPPAEVTVACVCCRDDIPKTEAVNLPCGHVYCGECLKILIKQAITDESKMPPRCCTEAIPAPVVKMLLPPDDREAFLKAVQQYSTPWEARIFCAKPTCGEFIPPRPKVDPRQPFHAVCRHCRTKVCVMCKRRAHPIGQDCPEDWELDAVLKMGEKSGWRRCYKCRTLVELTYGCTHMVCRCKAQFCYICGAVWDPAVGCPNFCNGEEVMEMRRLEEENRAKQQAAEQAELEAAAAAEAAERLEIEERTDGNEAFWSLREKQETELTRFRVFVREARWAMWSRQAQRKRDLMEKYEDLLDKVRDRHTKTIAHLEDRQISEEMELRASLDQYERSVSIRLRHMEAYCDNHGTAARDGLELGMPARKVTARDLRELGQQYHLRDGMTRFHQAKINVLRDRQAKRMEELTERQDEEFDRVMAKRTEEIENLATAFADEEDELSALFGERRIRLVRRWEVAIEILRRELETDTGLKFASVSTPAWPEDPASIDDGLDGIDE